jgi:hypothetical protein
VYSGAVPDGIVAVDIPHLRGDRTMTLQQLINKVLSDPKFWNELRKDPGKALRDAGETPTPEQIKSLKEVNYKALQDVGAAFAGGGTIT